MPGVMKGASVSKTVRVVRERVCGYSVDDGDGDSVELSCEGKEGGRMAVIPMLVFEFFIDTGEQPLDNVHKPPILQRIIGQDVAWILPVYYEKRRME